MQPLQREQEMAPNVVLLNGEREEHSSSDGESSESEHQQQIDFAVLPSNRVIQMAAPARAVIINLPQLMRLNLEKCPQFASNPVVDGANQ